MDRFGGWSPDGRHIAFDSKRDGNYEVYVIGADGSGVTRLTDAPGRDRFVGWLPIYVVRPTAELQEYAEALEEAFFYMENEVDDEVQALADDIFSSANFDLNATLMLNTLETKDSWSEAEARFATKFAETLLQTVEAASDLVLRGLNALVRSVSSLNPPGAPVRPPRQPHRSNRGNHSTSWELRRNCEECRHGDQEPGRPRRIRFPHRKP